MIVPLRAISVFHAVAESGSISRAAEALGVTPSAVSQQLHSLEVQLGTALIVRSGRSVMLTEAGEQYFRMIGGAVTQIADATRAIRGQRSATTLTIRASPSVATQWLLPRLAGFLGSHPGVEVRIDGTSEPTNFMTESVDLDIRHGKGDWPGLLVEPLAQERFAPVCAPSVATAGSLSPDDLPQHRLIHSVKSQVQWPAWFAAAGCEPVKRWKRVLFDRTHMAIDAAVGGMGVALESDLMTWRELRAGSLVRPVRHAPVMTLQTQWVVCPASHLRQRKVGSFLDWLRAEATLWEAERDA